MSSRPSAAPPASPPPSGDPRLAGGGIAGGERIIAADKGHLEIVQWLLTAMPDENNGLARIPVDTPMAHNGRTALHVACACRREQIIDCLLTQGHANPFQPDHQGQTALHHLIAQHSSTESEPTQGRMESRLSRIFTRLLEAAHPNNPRNEKIPCNVLPLVAVADAMGRTALHLACFQQCREAIFLLLREDAHSMTSLDTMGQSPLYLLARCSHDGAALLQDVLEELTQPQHAVDQQSILQALQRPDAYGWTALHHAVMCSEIDTVQCLLAYGVRPTALADGRTTLHLVGSGLRIHWDDVHNTIPYMIKWHEQYGHISDWVQCYGRWFVQYEAIQNGLPRARIPALPRIPDMPWDAFSVKANFHSGSLCSNWRTCIPIVPMRS